ncbi:hypothetical protein GLOIN_2v1776136 [Rhizophagus irregularis DAOM 181602=DAOM 197198]|uniref:Uncharacterized protein n=1 Tax=Rhizophagus irregularis (strain DAOM 181602 / DAOM 197198 / MUCL 43194) TaxID=747089 RepID=A0A2P4PXV3_RHIID|nr:hypothetical protein GLOIN_2v1776136 [Rhizophagus irregularis DAOM 181602=DAOM 197198]POG70217.1 hypothetical protein GLOIN_2v1776136 [Rhizophagus irregularis DAOM 181602=DAOM 197198]|eukprot:XP_025177083.1 hypothetical protein GLOIN_2v1776136 [Rhizophagus irregularis DAOM 181602=DAOM 197198]
MIIYSSDYELDNSNNEEFKSELDDDEENDKSNKRRTLASKNSKDVSTDGKDSNKQYNLYGVYRCIRAAPLSSEIAEDLWERLRRIKIQFCNFLENQEIKIHKYIEDNVFVLSCELLNLKNLNDDDDNANLATGHPNLFCND